MRNRLTAPEPPTPSPSQSNATIYLRIDVITPAVTVLVIHDVKFIST